MLIKRFKIIAFLFFFSSMCFGQTTKYSYSINHFTTKNSGLTHTRIHRLHLDHELNLICFSQKGLTKVLNWKAEYPIFESSAVEGLEHKLLYDEIGRVWSYNRNNRFSILSKDSTANVSPIKQLQSFLELGPNSRALLSANGEVFTYKGIENQRLISLQMDLAYNKYKLYAIDSQENIFLIKLDSKQPNEANIGYKFSKEGRFVDSLDFSLPINRLKRFENYQPIFASTQQKLITGKNTFDFLTQNFKFNGFVGAKYTYYDKERQLFWSINEGTLLGFHPTQGAIHEIKLLDKAIQNYFIIFHDHSVIIGSEHGLFVVRISENHFSSINNSTTKGSRRIKQLSNKEYFISTDGSLFQLDSNYHWKGLPLSNKFTHASTFIDAQEHIWSTNNHTIKLFKVGQGLVKTMYSSDASTKAEMPYDYWGYLEAKNGIIWTIIGNKLLGFSGTEKKYEVLLSLPKIENVIEILEIDATFLWVCTSKGLLKVNRLDGSVVPFSKQQKGAQFIPALDIRDFHIDTEGGYWLGTADNGLIKLGQHSLTELDSINQLEDYSVFNTEYGFPSNTINGIEEDDFGFLWLGSENGLIRFHKESHNFEVFTAEDGLSDNEFNRLSHYKSKDGNMFFGGINGLTIFHPKFFINSDQQDGLSIKRLYLLDQKRKIDITDSFQANGKVVLDQNDQSIELVYGSSQNKSHQLFYRLSEDKPWIKSERNKILLINPPFGQFHIYLREEDIAGKIINQLAIPIQTPLPFYYQTWFYLLVALGSFALAWFVSRWRSAKLRADQKRLEQIVKERTQKIETDKRTIERQAHQLKELIQSRSNFFRNLVHDLKNPLTIINGSIKLMEVNRKGILASDDRKYLDAIRENSGIVLNITDEILLLAQLQAKKLNVLKYAPVSALLFFEKLFETFAPKAVLEEKGYELEHNLLAGNNLALDTSKLEKIVLNLVSNAFKNTRKGDTITLRIFQNDENRTLKIEVIDTGKGIDEAELPFLFDPFYKAERYELQSYEGIGIGLAIVKELVQIYNGDITVTSKLGEGSSFNVLLPLQEVKATAFLPPKNELNSHSDLTEPLAQQFKPTLIHNHILIVEDAKNVRLFLKDFLEPYFLVTTASSSAEALEILNQSEKNQKSKSISLIITDLLMPNQDGFAFIEELKKNVKWNLLPIIVISSYDSPTIRKQAADLMVHQFLNKPFNPIKLLQHIYEVVSEDKTEDSDAKMNDFTYHSQLMTVINNLINERINSKDLNISTLSKEIAVSKRQLNRIVNQQTGLPPAKYILELKLRKAKELLESKSYYSVSDVSYALGFKSPKYFSQLFKNRYGMPPSSYL